MIYNLHFFKKGKLQKIIKEEIHMYGVGNKFLSCKAAPGCDELKLFDEGNKYLVTYKYTLSGNGKSVFKRD